MNIRLRLNLCAMLLASGLLAAASADAAGNIWRVNYTQPTVNSMNGKVETHVLATDPSFGSSGADYWNEVFPIPATQTLMETSVAGGGAPSISFVGQATTSTAAGSPMSGEPIDDDLDNWAARFSENVVDWELQGLDPRAFYNLVFYDLDSLTASITLTTEVDSDGDGVLDQTDTIAWDIGDDFSLFQGVQPDSAGVIRGRWTGSSSSFVDVAGFQVAESVPTVSIAVDIKPESCPNPLNVKSKGVIPVAILGTDDFDVTQVDVATVNLAGVYPIASGFEDVATPFEPVTGKIDCQFDCTTGGPDGYLDLTLKFDTQEIVEAIGEVDDGQCLPLQLTGFLQESFGGTPILGEDVVLILEKGK